MNVVSHLLIHDLHNLIELPLFSQSYEDVELCLREKISKEIWNQTRDQVWDQIGEPVKNNLQDHHEKYTKHN